MTTKYNLQGITKELLFNNKTGEYAILVGYDEINSKFRPIDVVYDELTGRSSIVVARAHGKTTYAVELTANHAAAAEITPTAGNKLAITSVFATTDSAAGEVKLDFLTSVIPAFRLYASKTNNNNTGEMHIVGAADEVLTLETTTGDQKVHLIINYREH